MCPPTSSDQWTSESQAEFTHFLGQSVYIWDKFNTRDLENLFNGSDESIERLGTLVADGHFITGASVKKNEEDHFDANETISDSFVRAYYGFAIPQIWQASGHHPFIIDTARDCDTKVDDEDLSTVCYGGKLYKLADPDGKSNSCSNCGGTGCYCPSDNPFSSLDGVKKMTNGNWGGVTVDDLIIGYIFPYLH